MIAWIVAVLTAVSALLLVGMRRGARRPWVVATGAVRTAMTHAHPADAVVTVVLLAWWLLAPVVWDDGWLAASLSNFSTSGEFSTYYNAFGTNHPFGYWLEWAQHWVTRLSEPLLLLRLLPLLCLAAIWVLCRWIFARTLTLSIDADPTTLWTLAATFLIGALAWGMTLRPEPEVALLVTGVLACTIRFLDRKTTAPLVLAAVLIVFALAAHPAGIVSLAPLLVTVPILWEWARQRLSVLATIITSSIALLVVLGFVGSDLELRMSDARAIHMYANVVAGWRDESARYSLLFTPGHEIPLRHGFVALMIAAILAYVMRKKGGAERASLDLASAALGIALILLVATPTKLPYHFGALLGVAAVAVASETARLRHDSRLSQGWRVVPFLATGVTAVAIAWSWEPRSAWNAFDLRSLSWVLGFESRFPLSVLAPLLPLIALAVVGVVELARGRTERLDRVPWLVASWSAVLLIVPVIAFTAGVLVVDTLKTDSWTLTRQNLDTLRGNLGCGLADDSFVAATGSMKPVATIRAAGERSPPSTLPAPPLAGLHRYVLVPARAGLAASPWVDLPRARRIGFFVARTPDESGQLELEWGRRRGGRVESLGTDEVSADLGSEERPDFVTWRFLPAEELPSRARGSDAVRIVLRSDIGPASERIVTAPVTYTNEPLVRRLDRAGSRSLVLPNLLLYLPCARLPGLGHGIVEIPDQIVAVRSSWPIGLSASPFEGLTDLYRLDRIPLTDTSGLLAETIVYDIDRKIPGAVLLPAEKTLTS
jgi:hypothetical protein